MCGDLLLQLASHRVDSPQAGLFGRALKRLKANGADLTPMAPFHLSILSNATVDLLGDELPIAAARHRIALSLTIAPFDQIFQQAVDGTSELHRCASDAILLLIDHRWLGMTIPTPGSDERIAGALARLTELLDGLASVASTPVILQTVSMPPTSLFGSLDRRIVGTARDADAINAGLVALAKERGHYLFDAAALCETVGSARFHDPVGWNLYKLPLASAVVPLYADWLGRLIGAIRGTSRKCLVLDLDNTMWGGVIGDDGMEGIRIGQGSGEGEAFLEVQRMALDLKRRGIFLAVASKNEEATARAVFQEHPEMLLKEADISVFQANWLDKASNLEAIANALNIGIDSLVLLDDNAAERAQVRAALPAVAVPEVGNDAAEYPAILAAAGYFEAVFFSDEDRKRADGYTANALRAEVKAKTRNLGEYLDSLEMVIRHAPFNPVDRPRIAQLINKSNQFNLTTRRYAEPAVAAIESDQRKHTFQTRLRDRFGDFGIIGIMIAEAGDDGNWDIDTWLMSCRVLGRKVEWSVLTALVQAATLSNASCITATYLPTPKNAMVAEHFDNLGFSRTSVSADGAVRYRLRVCDFTSARLPFHLEE